MANTLQTYTQVGSVEKHLFSVIFISHVDITGKMKQSRKEGNETSIRLTVDSLSCRSALLLSVVCCIALIHVELRIQEHHRLISSSVTYCGQMEKNILQKIQQNNKDWQITKGSHFGGQRQQTTGRLVTDIKDQVMFEPKGTVIPKFCF